MSDLDRLASALAAAIRRRHALDELAERGDSVPAQITAATEIEIRHAETALGRARATIAERVTHASQA